MCNLDQRLERLDEEGVSEVLRSLGLGQYTHLVASKIINGTLLSNCKTSDNLKSLGIKNTVHRKVLLQEIDRRNKILGTNH